MPLSPIEIRATLGDLRYMSLVQGEYITNLIKKYKSRDILELGTYHGVSTCYLASAAKTNNGKVTTVDVPSSLDLKPNINELIIKLSLDNIEVISQKEGAAWFLKELIKNNKKFDFIYLDAGHTWNCTGLLFFLSDKVLKPGGLMLFDDLDWTLNKAHPMTPDWAKKWTNDEKNSAQIGEVWDVLVKQSRNFYQFTRWGSWGICRKKISIKDRVIGLIK